MNYWIKTGSLFCKHRRFLNIPAAAEASVSRVYGGIHYRNSVNQGAIQGNKVGELIVSKVLE